MGDLNELVERLRTHADDCERLSMPEGRPALSRQAAAALTSLIAAEHHRDNAITMWHDEKTKREAAEAQLKAARDRVEILERTLGSATAQLEFLGVNPDGPTLSGYYAVLFALSLDTNKGPTNDTLG